MVLKEERTVENIKMLRKLRDVCTYHICRCECGQCPFYGKCKTCDLLSCDESIRNVAEYISKMKPFDDKWISLEYLLNLIYISYKINKNNLTLYDKDFNEKICTFIITDYDSVTNLVMTIIEKFESRFDSIIYKDTIKSYFMCKDVFSGSYEELYRAIKDRNDVSVIDKKLVECIVYPEKIYVPDLSDINF